MLNLFFRCMACRSGRDFQPHPYSNSSPSFHPSPPTFPLCSLCAETLVPAPRLCSNCASPACSPESCLRPWIERPHIHSYSARYLLFEPGYQVLKKWKIQRGLFFDRQILKSDDHLISTWNEYQANAVIPIPQRFGRAWKMGGSPAERIARWVSHLTGLSLIHGLEPLSGFRQKRQAELNLHERLQSPVRFKVRPTDLKNIQKVILVDDFMTSGHTLHQAATILRRTGVESVHVFCLGIRAYRFNAP